MSYKFYENHSTPYQLPDIYYMPKNHSEYSEKQLWCSERNSGLQEHNSELQNETPDSRNATPSLRTHLRASEHNSEPQNATPNPQEHSSDFQNITPNFWNATPEFHQKNSVHNSKPSKQLRLFDGTYSDRQNPIMKFPRTSQSVYNYVILLDSSCSVEVGIPLAHPLQSVDWPGIEQYLSPLQAKRIPYLTQGLWCATAAVKAQPQINSMTTPTPTLTHGKITQIRPF